MGGRKGMGESNGILFQLKNTFKKEMLQSFVDKIAGMYAKINNNKIPYELHSVYTKPLSF